MELNNLQRLICYKTQPTNQITNRHNFGLWNLAKIYLVYKLFVVASLQTGLDIRLKARRTIKVGIFARGRSGTSRDSNPAGLCCSLTHQAQCGSNELRSFMNPYLDPGTYAGLWLELDIYIYLVYNMYWHFRICNSLI